MGAGILWNLISDDTIFNNFRYTFIYDFCYIFTGRQIIAFTDT